MRPARAFHQWVKNDLVDAGKLDTDVFKRNTILSVQDMGSFFHDDRPITEHLWAKLLAYIMVLCRTGKIYPIEPLESFDVSRRSQALPRFHAQDRMDNASISFTNPVSGLQVHPLKYNLYLNNEKPYFLGGCLVRFGRSTSNG